MKTELISGSGSGAHHLRTESRFSIWEKTFRSYGTASNPAGWRNFFRYWHSLRDEGKKKQKDPDSPILVLTFFEIKRDFLLSLCLYIIKRMRISLLSLCYYYERKQSFYFIWPCRNSFKGCGFPYPPLEIFDAKIMNLIYRYDKIANKGCGFPYPSLNN